MDTSPEFHNSLFFKVLRKKKELFFLGTLVGCFYNRKPKRYAVLVKKMAKIHKGRWRLSRRHNHVEGNCVHKR